MTVGGQTSHNPLRGAGYSPKNGYNPAFQYLRVMAHDVPVRSNGDHTADDITWNLNRADCAAKCDENPWCVGFLRPAGAPDGAAG